MRIAILAIAGLMLAACSSGSGSTGLEEKLGESWPAAPERCSAYARGSDAYRACLARHEETSRPRATA
ncbi:MAG TPA: hypothetical protein VEC14_05815 [Reyranellaceae bacterium]|nr:hypothetical protein [Reyranellaceae bacterium]